MNLVESLLDVLALIGIILTGGFLVFFLGDLLLSVLDPSYGSIFKRRKKQQQEEEKPVVKEVEPQKEVMPEPLPAKTEEKVAVNDIEEEDKITFNDFDNLNEFDDAEALKEQQMLEGAEAFSRDDAMAELKAEEERFKQEQLAQALARQQESQKVEEVEESANEEKPEEEFDLDSIFVEDDDEDLADFNFDEEPVEEQNTTVEEVPAEEEVTTETDSVEETPVEDVAEAETPVEENTADEKVEEENNVEAEEQATEAEEVEAEDVEEVENVEDAQPDETTLALMAEIEKLKAELEEAKNATKPAEVEIKTIVNNMTEEDCLAKIEELKARLKANEKEFKQAKKEYLPLKKIMKTLDNDKKKLRRKEAIVAKQKVVLYGVNNVVDIDQEKAQKLAEELDLLDGLRLSVQHCEEVIKSNEERIPLLEKNYEILLQENTNIKADIANMEELLKTFQTVETSVETNEESSSDDTKPEGSENN